MSAIKFLKELEENNLQDYRSASFSLLPERTKQALDAVSPDKILTFNNRVLVLYFRTSKTTDLKKIFKKYWNFAEAPVVLVETEDTVNVFNGFECILDGNNPIPIPIDTDNLNYLSLISGEYFLKNSSNSRGKRIDEFLLKNITYARTLLIKSLSAHQSLDGEKAKTIANSLIGRIIFIRYLIDRNILIYHKGRKQRISNDDLKNILSNKYETYTLFKNLQSPDKGFNGDWFPISIEEEKSINDTHLKILKDLISGTELKTGQMSLFDYYDFSIIPVEFISNVYENFIGKERQRTDGAYYTPLFLVDYILNHTMDRYYKNNPGTYNCKILDPSCGSGIFLVEAFRKILSQYEKITGKRADHNTIKSLVKNNIFGIDYNENALQISIFSLYLAMLDYMDPKDIEKFRFPHLGGDNPNFFCNDFFDTEAQFNDTIKDINIIVGNPPYGRGTIESDSPAFLYSEKNNIYISGMDIVQVFMIRVGDFCHEYTEVSFVITSKVFYNLNGKNFRKQFLRNFAVNHILELSSVRRHIFENANTPVSVICFRKCKNKKEIITSKINYISIKPNPYFERLKILLISKSDFKTVAQSRLLKYDYLWKILVYGSYLDFNLIRRFRNKNTPKISDYVIKHGTGIKIGNRKNNVPEKYIDLPYVDPKSIQPFSILNHHKTFDEKKAEGVRNIGIFTPPSLLISLGFNKKLNIKAAILDKEAIFPASLTSIKSSSLEKLYSMMGYFHSTFFKYYMFQTASSVGIEREQLHNPEKFSLPFVHTEKISKIAKKLETIHSKSGALQTGLQEISTLYKELNCEIMLALGLTKEEEDLVDYVNRIYIPWIFQKNYPVAFGSYNFKDDRIDNYLQIFIEHYKEIYDNFNVTVYWSKYAIGIRFKITENSNQTNLVTWHKEESIENFMRLMHGKAMEDLFIQRDIKGFEKDGFYVVKPNEIKNWHKAIGYLDFYEFKEAIIMAGKKSWT